MENKDTTNNPADMLQFYIDIGVDESIEDAPINRIRESKVPAISAPIIKISEQPQEITPKGGSQEAAKLATGLIEKISSLEELKSALESFDGFVLKRTATQILFAEGNPKSKIMIIGDNPSADEDLSGKLFVGKSGHMLDQMLKSIGIDREENAYLTYLINWYPPGNRLPSEVESSLSLPFVQKHIELINPEIIICLGDIATKSLLGTQQSVSRIHGKWHEYKSGKMEHPAAIIPLFRPEYLLASPIQKSQAWEDLLKIKEKMQELKL